MVDNLDINLATREPGNPPDHEVWPEIDRELAKVRADHSAGLDARIASGDMDYSMINSAAKSGGIAERIVSDEQRDCPQVWVQRVVALLKDAHYEFGYSVWCDDYGFGEASIKRPGVVLQDLMQRTYELPREASLAPVALHAELMADFKRRYFSPARAPVWERLKSFPEPDRYETRSEWWNRVHDWINDHQANGHWECDSAVSYAVTHLHRRAQGYW